MFHHGTRDPRNILLEQDYCPHECQEDTPPYNKFSASPHGRSCGQDACNIPTPQSYCSRENITPDGHNRGNEPPFKDLQDSRTTTKMCTSLLGENSPAKKSYHSCSSNIVCKDSPLGESSESYSTPNYMTSKKPLRLNFKSIRPTEYGEQFLQPQLKDLPEARSYIQQFRNGIVGDYNGQQFDHHNRKTEPAAAPAMNNSPYKDSGAASLPEKPMGGGKCDGAPPKCARDKPRGTPFSCNDCKEPQCLYCWRKLQDPNGADFSFLDGFDTHETTWKPGRKNVDLFGQYLKPNHAGLKRGKRLEDNLQACNHMRKEELSACQSSHAQQEEPKWKPAHRINESHDHQNGGSINGKLECNGTCSSRRAAQTSSQCKEIEWPLGKGRGMGPVPGEWVPPFRKYAEDFPYNERNRGKGVGATPNLEDWVPPFRDEKLQQGHSWHRCKGIGDCTPRDQWLAPWRHPQDAMRMNEICSGR